MVSLTLDAIIVASDVVKLPQNDIFEAIHCVPIAFNGIPMASDRILMALDAIDPSVDCIATGILENIPLPGHLIALSPHNPVIATLYPVIPTNYSIPNPIQLIHVPSHDIPPSFLDQIAISVQLIPITLHYPILIPFKSILITSHNVTITAQLISTAFQIVLITYNDVLITNKDVSAAHEFVAVALRLVVVACATIVVAFYCRVFAHVYVLVTVNATLDA